MVLFFNVLYLSCKFFDLTLKLMKRAIKISIENRIIFRGFIKPYFKWKELRIDFLDGFRERQQAFNILLVRKPSL